MKHTAITKNIYHANCIRVVMVFDFEAYKSCSLLNVETPIITMFRFRIKTVTLCMFAELGLNPQLADNDADA